MPKSEVTISGRSIRDKHTHYEAITHIGPEQVTVTIGGDVFADFQRKYGRLMTSYEAVQMRVDFGRNEERVSECRDPSKSGRHLIGSVACLDDISVS